MIIIRAVFFLFCSAMVTMSIAQAKKSKANRKSSHLFTVSESAVTPEEFIYLYKKNHQNNKEDFSQQKVEEYLDLFINFKLKVEEARKRGMDTTEAFIKEFNQYKEELRKPYLPDNTLTDSLVRLTHARMREEVRASHILITLKPEATPADTLKAYNKIVGLRNEILAGADFGKTALANSEDPSAKMNQGDLGYFTAMQMVYPFETAAYETKVGEVSPPIRTRFGYHLIKVTDRKPARGEVEVAHIMIRTGAEKSDDEAKNAIFDIFDQLQAGVKWEELCQQHSEDPGSKDNGGKLRPFGVGVMSNIPEFERVAFELQNPGEISDPFKTQYGWHIMRLVQKIPLGSYEEVAPSLKNRVARDERTQISKQAFQNKLKKSFDLQENQPVKTKILALADTSLKHGKAAYANADKEVLFTAQGKPYSVASFFTYVQKSQRQNAAPQGAEKYSAQLYNNFVEHTILQLLEEKIAREHPEYRFLLKEYYEGILLFEIMEKEVWNKASADSVSQRKYYETHLTDYQADERVNAAFYSSASGDFVEPLKTAIGANDVQKMQEIITQKKVKTETGYYKKQDKAILKMVPWSKGVHSAENSGMYYLAWLKDILPAGTMSFEEARASIISDYQTFLEKNWIDQLKKKYPVKVNEKSKKYILQELAGKK